MTARPTSSRLRQFVFDYLRTGGGEGATRSGQDKRELSCLLLTVRDAQQELHTRPVMYLRDTLDNVVVVASNAGARMHPKWFDKLSLDPRVYVQLGSRRRQGYAVEALGDERSRLWDMMVDAYPRYLEYSELALPRHLPVISIRLEDELPAAAYIEAEYLNVATP